MGYKKSFVMEIVMMIQEEEDEDEDVSRDRRNFGFAKMTITWNRVRQ
jgi:hypothetical protein